MSKIQLNILDSGAGHKTEFFDAENYKDRNELVQRMQALISDGYKVFVKDGKGENYKPVIDCDPVNKGWITQFQSNTTSNTNLAIHQEAEVVAFKQISGG